MSSIVFNFDDFSMNEAKIKELSQGAKDILKMLENKPSVKMNVFEDEKGAYTVSGIKTYLSDKYTSAKIDQFIHELQNDKSVKLKTISIKNYKYNEYYPYYYIGDFDAKEYKTKLEKNSKERYAEETFKRSELIRKKKEHEAELKDKKKVAAEKRRTARKKKTSLKESVMKFREYTFGIKEDVDLDIAPDFYDKVYDIMEEDYGYFIWVDDPRSSSNDDILINDFENSDFYNGADDPEEYARQLNDYIENKSDI